MIFDLERIDTWLIKGFGGAADMIQQRCNTDKFLEKERIIFLKRAVENLKKSLALGIAKSIVSPFQTKEEFDAVMFRTLLILSDLVNARTQSHGPLHKQAHELLQGYIPRLEQCIAGFEPKP